MQVRPVQESDIPQVIALFHENYGDSYSMPEFYDPQWVKRGIYSDHIIWLVVEDEGKVVASGAVILNSGDYNDLIGEIGRVVVDPHAAGKGLGGTLLSALVEAADQQVEFTFAEARTVHPKTQKINDHIGLAPLGFLPMHYRMQWRESLALAGQLHGNGRSLRRAGEAQVIPVVAPLARLSLHNLQLDETVTVRDDARAYPVEHAFAVAPLTAAALIRLLKIEQGRVSEPEIFSGTHIDQGMRQLQASKATYLVASEGERTLGAVGYTYNERHQSLRVIELIAGDNALKGALLRMIVERAEEEYQAQVIECDVSAYSPSMQQTLFEMGFLPTGYVPGMVFHETARYDIVKMAKLNVAWDLGAYELTENSRAYHDLVAPAFERAAAERDSRLLAQANPALRGMTGLEALWFQRACEETTPAPGTSLPADALHLVLAGSVSRGAEPIGAGGLVGAGALLGRPDKSGAVSGEGTRLLTLAADGFAGLCERYPRLGIKLVRNLAAYGG